MTTNDVLSILLVAAMGFLLGLIFFGGLWWTIRRMLHSPRPALWMLGSLVLRMGITLAGFWLVAGHDWKRLLICLAGFVMARLALTLRPGSWQVQHTDFTKPDRHASQP